MPRPGFKTLTVPEALYNELKEYAKQTHRSVANLVTHLVKEEQERAVCERLYERLKRFAEERFMTVPRAIEYLMKKVLQAEEA